MSALHFAEDGHAEIPDYRNPASELIAREECPLAEERGDTTALQTRLSALLAVIGRPHSYRREVAEVVMRLRGEHLSTIAERHGKHRASASKFARLVAVALGVPCVRESARARCRAAALDAWEHRRRANGTGTANPGTVTTPKTDANGFNSAAESTAKGEA